VITTALLQNGCVISLVPQELRGDPEVVKVMLHSFQHHNIHGAF